MWCPFGRQDNRVPRYARDWGVVILRILYCSLGWYERHISVRPAAVVGGGDATWVTQSAVGTRRTEALIPNAIRGLRCAIRHTSQLSLSVSGMSDVSTTWLPGCRCRPQQRCRRRRCRRPSCRRRHHIACCCEHRHCSSPHAGIAAGYGVAVVQTLKAAFSFLHFPFPNFHVSHFHVSYFQCPSAGKVVGTDLPLLLSRI